MSPVVRVAQETDRFGQPVFRCAFCGDVILTTLIGGATPAELRAAQQWHDPICSGSPGSAALEVWVVVVAVVAFWLLVAAVVVAVVS